MMASVYENTSLYIPLVQPRRTPSYISIDPSSYWHVSGLYSLLFDSITVPSRTRPEHPFHMDMFDFTARVNIQGHRKIVNPDVAILFDKPQLNDLMALGWHEVHGERPITATVIRGTINDVDDVTVKLSRGSMVSERYVNTWSFLILEYYILNYSHCPLLSPKYSLIMALQHCQPSRRYHRIQRQSHHV